MDKRTGKKDKKKKSKLDGNSLSTDKFPVLPLKPDLSPSKK